MSAVSFSSRHFVAEGEPSSFHRHTAQAVRRSLVDWIEDAGCNWSLTLNPNRCLSLAAEQDVIRLALADADREVLGSRFNKVDARKRLLAFIMPEHVTSNLHFHLAMKPGLEADEDAQRERIAAFAEAWRVRAPSGSHRAEPIKNLAGWGRYITKELWRGQSDFMISSMWWPARQRRHVLDSSWLDPMEAALGVK